MTHTVQVLLAVPLNCKYDTYYLLYILHASAGAAFQLKYRAPLSLKVNFIRQSNQMSVICFRVHVQQPTYGVLVVVTPLELLLLPAYVCALYTAIYVAAAAASTTQIKWNENKCHINA